MRCLEEATVSNRVGAYEVWLIGATAGFRDDGMSRRSAGRFDVRCLGCWAAMRDAKAGVAWALTVDGVEGGSRMTFA